MRRQKDVQKAVMNRMRQRLLFAFSIFLIVFMLFGVLYVYRSASVGYGHPFYRLKQNLEVAQLRFTRSPLQRIALHRRLIERRMKELTMLAKTRSGISPLFLWIPFAHSSKLPPTDPIVETVQELVSLTDQMIELTNAMTDLSKKNEAIKVVSESTEEQKNALQEVAWIVGLIEEDVMGGVARGIQKIEVVQMETDRVQALEKENVLPSDHLIDVLKEKGVDVLEVEMAIVRERVKVDAFLQKLSGKGVNALKAEAFSKKLRTLVEEANELFLSGNFFGADQRIGEANAFEEEAMHFVDSLQEQPAFQSEAREELEQAYEEYQFLDADIERAKSFPNIVASQTSFLEGIQNEIRRLHNDAQQSLQEGNGELARARAWGIRREIKRAGNLLDTLEGEGENFIPISAQQVVDESPPESITLFFREKTNAVNLFDQFERELLLLASVLSTSDKKKAKLKSTLSFGPFLAIGGWIVLFFGPSLLFLTDF